jgi:hypothetical protein
MFAKSVPTQKSILFISIYKEVCMFFPVVSPLRGQSCRAPGGFFQLYFQKLGALLASSNRAPLRIPQVASRAGK